MRRPAELKWRDEADSRANASELCAAPDCGAPRGGARHNADCTKTGRTAWLRSAPQVTGPAACNPPHYV